jgi:hypothetical protein
MEIAITPFDNQNRADRRLPLIEIEASTGRDTELMPRQ